jgi:hypothetical protein
MAAAGQGKQHNKENRTDERPPNATQHEIDNASIYVKNYSMIAARCARKSSLTMMAGLTAAVTRSLILARLSGQIGGRRDNMKVKAPFRARAGFVAPMEQA